MGETAQQRRVRPVILSGGSGTRLWPLSRLGRPKQFVALRPGEETMLQQALRRVAEPHRFQSPVIVASEDHADAVEAQCAAVGIAVSLIVEPAARNTAAAIALAAMSSPPDEILLVMPSDHAIADGAAFRSAVEAALPHADAGWLVTLGIAPDRAETGYGYIERGDRLDGRTYRVAAFAEKPDAETAAAFVASKRYEWNAGIFIMRAGTCVEALERLAPDIADAVRASLGTTDPARLRPDPVQFGLTPSRSFDKAVMEKADKVAVVPVDMGWSDIGSWEAVHALGPRDAADNALQGDVVAPGSNGCLIRSDGPTVVALGVSDLVIVATERAVLIVPRGESQRVKEAIDALEARRR
jgi:mannose-1-phosphate guanylyltransferase/mannose-1-phosphate guanylyltransferase/mannose-6-phosphate isomerase